MSSVNNGFFFSFSTVMVPSPSFSTDQDTEQCSVVFRHVHCKCTLLVNDLSFYTHGVKW